MPLANWRAVSDRLAGKAPKGAKRHKHWRKTRNTHLKRNPKCAFCNGRKECVAHHLIPFHLAPELELVQSNLITLCEKGKYGISNCHLLFGHRGSWSRVNVYCKADIARWRIVLEVK